MGAVILDGGMSNALEGLGYDVGDELWTARTLLEAPEAIAAVHQEYFAAGAQVATTASYQASVPSLVAAGLSESQARDALRRSVTIAREVVDGLAGDGVQRRVAASVGPYGAILADGSEYRGRYGLSAAQLRDFHAPRLDTLLDGGPDLLALETIPDLDEAQVLIDLVSELGVPAWLSYSIDGDATRAGQPLREAFAAAVGAPSLVAVGVNCSRPADVSAAVPLAASASGIPVVVYPNSGEEWVDRGWVGQPGLDPQAVRAWVADGAEFVGGCCRVGPADIAALAAVLDETGSPER